MSDQSPAPTTEQPQGPAGEQWLNEVLDQVFLTPRVVDERAFEELSGSLKTLVRDATGQSRALIETTGEVKLLSDQLREATRELQTRVDTAVRVIPTLDQRVAKAEQVLDVTGRELAAKVSEMRDVASRGVDRERLESQVRAETAGLLERIVQEQVAGLRERMSAAVAEVQAMADRRGAEVLERIRAAQEKLDQSLLSSESQAEHVAKRLDALIEARLARAAELANEAARRVGEALASKSAEVETALESMDHAAARASQVQATIDGAVQEAGLRLGAAISEADRRADSIGEQASVRIAELREKAVEVVEIAAATRVEDIAATVRETVDAAERASAAGEQLRGLVSKTEELSLRAGHAEQEFGTLLSRTAEMRDQLSTSLASASTNIEGLSRRLDEVKAQYEDLARKGEGDGGIQDQVRQMGTWLGQLLTQGDVIGRGLDRLIKQAGPMVERLERRGGQGAADPI